MNATEMKEIDMLDHIRSHQLVLPLKVDLTSCLRQNGSAL